MHGGHGEMVSINLFVWRGKLEAALILWHKLFYVRTYLCKNLFLRERLTRSKYAVCKCSPS